MTLNHKTLVKLLMGSLIVLGLTGCAGKSQRHVEAVNAADTHWKQMRSTNILRSAQGYFDTGDLDSAELTLAEAVMVDPDNPQLHLLAGRVALERGQLERAYGRLAKAISLDDSLSNARYYQGIVLERWQRYDAALDRYQEAYDLLPDNVAYLLAVSEMLVATDKLDEAIELLSGKTTYFDQSAGIRMALGQLYVMKRDYEHAVGHLHEAALLNGDDLGTQEELARAQLGAGRYTEAIRSLRRLIDKPAMQDRRDLQHLLGYAYEKAGQSDKARRVFLSLRRTDPDDVDAWCKLGELAWQDGDYATALTSAQRVMNLAPDRYEGFLLSGMIWQKRDQDDRALAMFDQAAELAPDRADPLILRGITLHRQGRKTQAAAAYAEALRRQPDDQRAKQLLATVASVPTP